MLVGVKIPRNSMSKNNIETYILIDPTFRVNCWTIAKKEYMKQFSGIIRDIERAAINENNLNSDEGVIVVNSIEEFMAQNNTTHLKDLDKVLGVDGAR